MSQELIEMLQGALERELTVSIQYMWHHVMGKGIASPSVRDILKKISIVEMKHAEAIAERLDYFGETPTTKVKQIVLVKALDDMLKADLAAEREAISFYKQIVEKADAEKDYVTRNLFEDILAAEEDHEAQFAALLK
jgi:bacterioferritin